jgi:hypothetical protein
MQDPAPVEPRPGCGGGCDGQQAAMASKKKGTRRKADLLGQAQQVIYEAWETASRERRLALAGKAIGISPDCADAYVLLAEETAVSRLLLPRPAS